MKKFILAVTTIVLFSGNSKALEACDKTAFNLPGVQNQLAKFHDLVISELKNSALLRNDNIQILDKGEVVVDEKPLSQYGYDEYKLRGTRNLDLAVDTFVVSVKNIKLSNQVKIDFTGMGDNYSIGFGPEYNIKSKQGILLDHAYSFAMKLVQPNINYDNYGRLIDDHCKVSIFGLSGYFNGRYGNNPSVRVRVVNSETGKFVMNRPLSIEKVRALHAIISVNQ